MRSGLVLLLSALALGGCGDDDGGDSIDAMRLVDGIYDVSVTTLEDSCDPARATGTDEAYLYKQEYGASLVYMTYVTGTAPITNRLEVDDMLATEYGCGPRSCASPELSGCSAMTIAAYSLRFHVTSQSRERIVGELDEQWRNILGCEDGVTPRLDCSAKRQVTYMLKEECEMPCSPSDARPLVCECPG